MFEGIAEGDIISATVNIKSIAKAKTKNGKPYLKLVVNDGHNNIPAFFWDMEDCEFNEGDNVKIKAKYSQYDGKDKLDVVSLTESKDAVKLPTLNKTNLDEFKKRYQSIRKAIKDEDFNNVLDNILSGSIWDMYCRAPAARSNHQAYIGGLLEHSVLVAEECAAIAAIQAKNLNVDLLLTGALLHDVGKIREYEYEKKIDRSTIGRLVGHTCLGLMIISRLMPEDFPAKKQAELFHMIISHHGKRDWGAPIEPLMKEASILHMCDNMDFYGSRFDEIKAADKSGKTWSQRDELCNRQWYLDSMEATK